MKNILTVFIAAVLYVSGLSQSIGSKVSFTAVDGKTYTGIVKEIENSRYKIKYDGFEFESWLDKSILTFLNDPSIPSAPAKKQQATTTQNNQQSPGRFHVGQRVEVYDIGWYKATVLEIGTGKNEGYYKLDLDNFPNSAGFYKADKLRIPPNAEPLGPPRSGIYKIIGTGSGRNTLIGYFILSGGNSYTIYDLNMKSGGKGNYNFNDPSQKVVWLSGPFKDKKFGGDFKSSFQGSKHSIILNSGTTAENIKE